MEEDLVLTPTEREQVELETPASLKNIQKLWQTIIKDSVNEKRQKFEGLAHRVVAKLLKRERRTESDGDVLFDREVEKFIEERCNTKRLTAQMLKQRAAEEEEFVQSRLSRWRRDYVKHLRENSTPAAKRANVGELLDPAEAEMLFPSDDEHSEERDLAAETVANQNTTASRDLELSDTGHARSRSPSPSHGAAPPLTPQRTGTNDNNNCRDEVLSQSTIIDLDSVVTGSGDAVPISSKEDNLRRQLADSPRPSTSKAAMKSDSKRRAPVKAKKRKCSPSTEQHPKRTKSGAPGTATPNGAASSDGAGVEDAPPINDRRLKNLLAREKWPTASVQISRIEIAVLRLRRNQQGATAWWAIIVNTRTNFEFLARYEDYDIFSRSQRAWRKIIFKLAQFLRRDGYRTPICYQGKWYAVGCRHPVSFWFYHGWCIACYLKELVKCKVMEPPCLQKENGQWVCEPCRYASESSRTAWHDALRAATDPCKTPGKTNKTSPRPSGKPSKKKELPQDVYCQLTATIKDLKNIKAKFEAKHVKFPSSLRDVQTHKEIILALFASSQQKRNAEEQHARDQKTVILQVLEGCANEVNKKYALHEVSSKVTKRWNEVKAQGDVDVDQPDSVKAITATGSENESELERQQREHMANLDLAPATKKAVKAVSEKLCKQPPRTASPEYPLIAPLLRPGGEAGRRTRTADDASESDVPKSVSSAKRARKRETVARERRESGAETGSDTRDTMYSPVAGTSTAHQGQGDQGKSWKLPDTKLAFREKGKERSTLRTEIDTEVIDDSSEDDTEDEDEDDDGGVADGGSRKPDADDDDDAGDSGSSAGDSEQDPDYDASAGGTDNDDDAGASSEASASADDQDDDGAADSESPNLSQETADETDTDEEQRAGGLYAARTAVLLENDDKISENVAAGHRSRHDLSMSSREGPYTGSTRSAAISPGLEQALLSDGDSEPPAVKRVRVSGARMPDTPRERSRSSSGSRGRVSSRSTHSNGTGAMIQKALDSSDLQIELNSADELEAATALMDLSGDSWPDLGADLNLRPGSNPPEEQVNVAEKVWAWQQNLQPLVVSTAPPPNPQPAVYQPTLMMAPPWGQQNIVQLSQSSRRPVTFRPIAPRPNTATSAAVQPQRTMNSQTITAVNQQFSGQWVTPVQVPLAHNLGQLVSITPVMRAPIQTVNDITGTIITIPDAAGPVPSNARVPSRMVPPAPAPRFREPTTPTFEAPRIIPIRREMHRIGLRGTKRSHQASQSYATQQATPLKRSVTLYQAAASLRTSRQLASRPSRPAATTAPATLRHSAWASASTSSMYQATVTAARGRSGQAYSTDNLKLDSSNNPRHATHKDGACQTELSAKRAFSRISRTTNTRGPYADVAQLPDEKEKWCHASVIEQASISAIQRSQRYNAEEITRRYETREIGDLSLRESDEFELAVEKKLGDVRRRLSGQAADKKLFTHINRRRCTICIKRYTEYAPRVAANASQFPCPKQWGNELRSLIKLEDPAFVTHDCLAEIETTTRVLTKVLAAVNKRAKNLEEPGICGSSGKRLTKRQIKQRKASLHKMMTHIKTMMAELLVLVVVTRRRAVLRRTKANVRYHLEAMVAPIAGEVHMFDQMDTKRFTDFNCKDARQLWAAVAANSDSPGRRRSPRKTRAI